MAMSAKSTSQAVAHRASATSATAPRNLTQRKQLRMQARVFDVAMELFAKRSYEEVTVEEICQQAEVGRSTFFRYFFGKSGLLRESNRRMVEKVMRDLTQTETAEEMLDAYRRRAVEAWVNAPRALRHMARDWLATGSLGRGGQHVNKDLLDLVSRVLAVGVERGEFRPLDTGLFAQVVVHSLAPAITGWYGSTLHWEPDDVSREVLAVLVRGFRPLPESRKKPRSL